MMIKPIMRLITYLRVMSPSKKHDVVDQSSSEHAPGNISTEFFYQ